MEAPGIYKNIIIIPGVSISTVITNSSKSTRSLHSRQFPISGPLEKEIPNDNEMRNKLMKIFHLSIEQSMTKFNYRKKILILIDFSSFFLLFFVTNQFLLKLKLKLKRSD
jgi:hypothetical protein